jgi:hypothetical protein|eukprot:scaffold1506_cov220-Chaetoceros_neogracile.AAC.5
MEPEHLKASGVDVDESLCDDENAGIAEDDLAQDWRHIDAQTARRKGPFMSMTILYLSTDSLGVACSSSDEWSY